MDYGSYFDVRRKEFSEEIEKEKRKVDEMNIPQEKKEKLYAFAEEVTQNYFKIQDKLIRHAKLDDHSNEAQSLLEEIVGDIKEIGDTAKALKEQKGKLLN